MAEKLQFANREDLDRWTKDMPEPWVRAIATRAALRALPLVGNAIGWRQIDDGTRERLLLMAFRAGFLSWAPGTVPALDLGYVSTCAAAAARAAATDTDAAAKANPTFNSAAAAVRVLAAGAAAATADSSSIPIAASSVAAAAAAAAASSARAADAVAARERRREDSTADVYATAVSIAATGAAANNWDAVARDVEWLLARGSRIGVEEARRLFSQPLWQGRQADVPNREHLPIWARDPWNRFERSAFAKTFGFAPWITWYRSLLADGWEAQRPTGFGQALVARIAVQQDQWWERGAMAVNADVARWLEKATAPAAPVTGDGLQAKAFPPGTRIFVRLPDALAKDFNPLALHAPSPELFRRVLALGPGAEASALLSPLDPAVGRTPGGRMLTNDTLIVDRAETAAFLAEKGARLYGDVQFKIFGDAAIPTERRCRYWEPAAGSPPADSDHGSLDDVLDHINAREAWAFSEGDGTTIAVIDTGIHPDLPEIGHNRRHSLNPNTLHHDRHWVDKQGHGSMCAAIAAGGGAAGRFSGVAPLANVVSCRTDFSASDISDIYATLIEARRAGLIAGPLVVNNSYGLYACQSPGFMPDDHPFMSMIELAMDEGIVVVFAAGNNHHDVKCKHPPQGDGPNTIWGPNSHDRVLSVGTVNRDNSNQDAATPHVNSSRGPGEWAAKHPKPDCVAPTYGTVIWGNERRNMAWWGTSGAAPQVSGLAALIQAFAVNSSSRAFRSDEVNDIIRDSCRPLNAPPTCVGRGLIDCGAALKAAKRRLLGGRSV